MNLPVFLRRVLIVFFSICLIINFGYNFFTWIKNANFSTNKNELGTIKIYSSEKKYLMKVKTAYFEGDKTANLSVEDIFGKPVYYLTFTIGKNHLKYAKQYFDDKKYKITTISSSDNEQKIELEKSFISLNRAEEFSKNLKVEIGIDSEIISRTDIHRKVYCLYSDNISFGFAEKIAKENPNFEIKWTKKIKNKK